MKKVEKNLKNTNFQRKKLKKCKKTNFDQNFGKSA